MAILRAGNVGYSNLTSNPYFSIPANYPGLIVNYNMQTSGAFLLDRSPNKLNGTLILSPTENAQTIVGKTISFDGSTQAVNLGDNDNFSFPAVNDVFTIIYIAKRTAATSGALFGKYNTGSAEYSCQMFGDKIYFFTQDSVNGGYRGRISATNDWAVDSTYRFIVLKKTAGAANANHEIWVDNVQKDATNFTAGAYTQMVNGASPLYINYGGTLASVYMPCEQEYFAIFHSALTTAEMTNFYNTFNQIRTRNKILSNLKITP